MKALRFGELAIGARFCFRHRRYEKVAAEVGRDEDRGGNLFHASTEVLAEAQSVEWSVKSESRLTPCPSPSGRVKAARAVWRPRPRYVRNRLGRSPDRDLRPYGTL